MSQIVGHFSESLRATENLVLRTTELTERRSCRLPLEPTPTAASVQFMVRRRLELTTMRKRDELTDPKSCMNRAADDEMTFVLLGRDIAAPVAIRAWIDERIRTGKNQPHDPQIVEAHQCAATMERDRA